jgi:hypothetical protein
MRRRLIRRTTAKTTKDQKASSRAVLVREGTMSMSARHISVLSKKIRAEDRLPPTLPPTGRRPTFAMPA